MRVRNGRPAIPATNAGQTAGIGLTAVAKKRAEDLIVRRLRKLKTDDDPNVHFPVDEISKQLWFLLQIGESATAKRLLQRVVRELPMWPGLRGGFATSGVLTMLAELLAELDGDDAARVLLGLAVETGKAEQHRGFRKSALNAANQQLDVPNLSAAIAQAHAVRNAGKRRDALVPLLVKKGAWNDLAEILNEASDHEELLKLLHSVICKLPGGARLM
ncbi:MAG: hypothetical protein KDA89_12300 [Planctomycetaceae bacterium]|nr:hypothetical protein [Planctomycetaceae bacterium]